MDVLFPVTERAVGSVVYASERRSAMPEVRRGGRVDEALKPQVEADLENAHRLARETLRLKRKEIAVETFAGAAGRLTTPAFEYRVEADVDGDDSSVALWRREIALVGGVADATSVLAAFGHLLDTVLVRFEEALDVPAVVDRLETRDDPAVHLDYDMRCRWCEVTVDGVPATVRLEGHEMRVLPNAGTPVPVTELWSLVQDGALGRSSPDGR